MNNETHTVNLRLPKELHKRISEMAKNTKRSFHTMAIMLLEAETIAFELEQREKENDD